MKILLVDDHHLIRIALRGLLSDLDTKVEIDEAGSCEEALSKSSSDVDLVMLDLDLPGISGTQALEAVRSAFESARVVVLSGTNDPKQVWEAIDRGAAGYVIKSETPNILVTALRLVLAGGIYVPAAALQKPPKPTDELSQSTDLISRLPERQRQALRLAISGKSNKVIARELNVAEGTVKAHLSSVFRTIGVSNRTEAVAAVAKINSVSNKPI